MEKLSTLLVLIKKELLIMLKNKKNRIVLIMPILMQTLIFGYVATFDLNNIDYYILDNDNSNASRDLISRFEGSSVFVKRGFLESPLQFAETLDNKEALLILNIKEDFQKKINMQQTAEVQVIVDGRNSNVSGTAMAYATRMIEEFNKDILEKNGINFQPITLSSRAWFNPNLETRWNVLAGMIALLAVLQIIILSSHSLAIEKEQGTFDQLLVSPLSPITILIGKAIPPMCVGIVQSTIVLCVAKFWFSIPFAGSYFLLYLSLFFLNFAVIGLGLCISVFSANMQQALLYSFTCIMPMILLSGLFTPISSMPQILQALTLVNPIRYGVELTQRIFLEGSGFLEVQHLLLPLFLIGIIGILASTILFRKTLN